MSKKNAIQNAADIVKKQESWTIPEYLRREIEFLDNPEYRVAVVGKYQVGKSTLINHVFLGDNPLLLEGKGLCTTAVATEVAYGQTYKLETYKWVDEAKTQIDLDQTIENPTDDDVRNLTVASTSELRVALAARLPKVRILAPNEHLKEYTIVDTPGIDDPESALLMNTTYRVIPEADLAIVVVGCKQLDEVEMELLRKNLVNDGISRLMVLLSYRPDSERTEETRKEILDTVKAQLANIGKENVPVEMFCFDESVPDILNTISQIRLVIRNFLVKNALEGRNDKVAFHMKRFLNSLLVELAAKISTSGKSESEKAALSSELDEKEKELRGNFEGLFKQMERDLDAVRSESLNRFEKKIGLVFDDCIRNLEACKGLDDVQQLLKSFEQTLNDKASDAMCDLQDQVNRDVQQVILRHKANIASASNGFCNFVQKQLDVKPGIVAKIPELLCQALTVILINILLPMGWITAALGRLFQMILPYIKKLTVQNLVKAILVRKIKTALGEGKEKIIESVQTQFKDNFEKIIPEFREGLIGEYNEQIAAIRAGIRQSSTASEKDALLALKSELEMSIEAL